MHKLSFIHVFIFIIASGFCKAQNALPLSADNERTFTGGLAFGANVTQVDGDGFAGYNKLGFNFGPMVYAHISNLFSASMELNFSQKGSKVRYVTESTYTGTTIEFYDIKLNYVEVPVLLQITPPGRLHYAIGASYGRLISSKESAITVAPVNLDPNLYPFNKQDIQYILGLNYRFYKHWFIGGRFSYTLNSIRDAKYAPQNYSTGGNEKNNVFTFRLMYLF